MIESTTKQVRVYACGGAGINIGRSLLELAGEGKMPASFAPISLAFLDTSNSNTRGIPEELFIKVTGCDGAGKVRQENHREIKAYCEPAINKFQPLDLNIILCSASGGTGNVFAGYLASTLLAAGHKVILGVIGSFDSQQELNNTIASLKSFEGVSQVNKRPLVSFYLENNRDTVQSKVNQEIVRIVKSLALLFSGKHEGLDSQDLTNLLDYRAPCPNHPVCLTYLDIANQSISEHQNFRTLGVATLALPDTVTHPGIDIEYQAVGYIQRPEEVGIELPVHFSTVHGPFPAILDNLSQKAKERQARSKAAMITPNISLNTTPTEDGMIF